MRSVVLTSGTLSPMDTFASELDVRFPVTLEADHVIDRKQEKELFSRIRMAIIDYIKQKFLNSS